MVRYMSTLAALTLVLAAARAQAPVGQPPVQPYSAPVLNPYLNLLNRGNPAINYYGIIRPQVQQEQQLQMLQFGLTRTNEEIATTAAGTPGTPGALADTGHVAGFMNYGRYFNTVNAHGK